MKKTSLSVFLLLFTLFLFTLSSCGSEANGNATQNGNETKENKITLQTVEKISKTIEAGSDTNGLFPKKLLCTDSEGNKKEVAVLEWKNEDFDPTKSGSYFFTPVFSDKYVINDVEKTLSCIEVIPSKKISRLEPFETDIKSFCGSQPQMPVIMAYDEFSNPIDSLPVVWSCPDFKNNKLGKHTFTFTVDDGFIYDGECPDVNVTVQLNDSPDAPYVAPDGWYGQQYETGSVAGGDYNLTYGVMGLKVYCVEKALGMWSPMWGYYKGNIINNVTAFQRRNGLNATGIVDLETWLRLGLKEDDWYSLGTYVCPVSVTKQSTRQEIIDVFVNTAKSYIGTPYVVGAAGKPGEGIDCSGLVLQCMYAIGIYPEGLDPVQHSTLEEFNSRLMWEDPKLKSVERKDLQKGDLVFYRGPYADSVCHVAIYLGDGFCVEALSGKVEILYIDKGWFNYTIKGYKRIVAG